jgi:hypothetical protein
MTVRFHPEFPKDIRRFEASYKEISEGLTSRFRKDIEDAIEAVKALPQGAGHFLRTESQVVSEFRRRNLRGLREDTLVFGSVIPSRSDPLTWLTRFGHR